MLARAARLAGMAVAGVVRRSARARRGAAAASQWDRGFADDSTATGGNPDAAGAKQKKPRRRFNFAPAIDVSPDAHKALGILAGMKEGAVGVRASYVPAGLEMRFSFDFVYDDAKQHRFDEIITLDGGKILMVDGGTLPQMLGRVLLYDAKTGEFELREKDPDRTTLVEGPVSASHLKPPPAGGRS